MVSTLVLRNESKKTGLWSIVVEYSNNAKFKRISTGIKVDKKFWAGGKIKKGGSNNHESDNRHIHSIKQNVDSIILKHIELKGVPPTTEYLTTEYEKLNDVIPEKTFTDYIEEFIQLRTDGKVSPNTLKGYRNLKDNITEYQELNNVKLNFEEVSSIVFFEKYTRFLISKKYYNSTISRRLSVLKTILTYFYNAGLNKSINFKLYKFENKKQKNKEVVTLSLKELEGLKALDLRNNPRLEYVRDLFILQAWTGLRYIDVIRLNKSHLKKVQGHSTINIKIDILKTDDFSDLPLFADAERILDKYAYQLRRISNDKYNEYIKEVCRMVPELDCEVTFKHFNGKNPIVISKKKSEFISTHTARRTFITLMLDLGIKQDKIMKWSNHSDIRVFNGYNNVRQGEQAEAEKVIKLYNEQLKMLN